MNGADRLCDVLLANGVDVCFANPGTSEMHFVAALDRKPQMRCVLGLFEGVVTGAADGYGRMAGKPAATLLHTGPGLANGLANLHNARRARTPMINVVGDHASYHLGNDAPLTADIESLARPMSHYVRRIADARDVGPAVEQALAAALGLPGVATLILPGDAAWSEVADAAIPAIPRPRPARVAADGVDEIAGLLRGALASGRRPALLLAGGALRAGPLQAAGRIAEARGIRLVAEFSNSRVERGAGRVAIDKIPYVVDAALSFLRDIDLLVLVGSQVPVGFFAYPGKPGRLIRDDCRVVTLARPGEDLPAALADLADALDVPTGAPLPSPREAPALQPGDLGALTPDAVCRIVAARLPENAILVDEAVSGGRLLYPLSHAAAPHDYLQLTGGAIGVGIPLAAGAAIACPDRKVVAVQADGSGMYTVQGLWTQAREALDVVTVILANRAYAILQGEMRGVGVTQVGRNADRMLRIDEPTLDWVGLARSMGVPGTRVTTGEDLLRALAGALAGQGPFLIEAVV
jgi:acetolactate synthase-1/2/3 large subunit